LIRATARVPAANQFFQEMRPMKEIDKKDSAEVSGGYFGPLVVDGPCIPNPEEDYPQYPNGSTGEDDLPIGSR
jgi:hypothetical protein